jgi:DNA-binding GntR family transcriptional regulator
MVGLREQALAHLRGMVISGGLRPGEIVSASSLAVTLGISATPVREAMLDLVSVGLLEPVRGRGFRVVALSDEDLDEILQLRLKLEVPTLVEIARLSAMKAADCQRLSALAARTTQAAERADLPRFLDLDRDLHLRLLALAGSRRLVDLVARLRDQTRLYGIEELARSGALVETANEHMALIDAISRGDCADVTTLATRHLQHTRGAWAGRIEADPDRWSPSDA